MRFNIIILIILAILLLPVSFAYTTQVAATISSLSGATQLDNSDGTSITVSILDASGSSTLVSGNAGAGTYRQGATILSPSVELEYDTAYKFKLETEQGDFTFDFTTPTNNNVELHTGQTTSYGTGPDDADNDGTAKSFTDNGDGTVTDQHTGLMWQKSSTVEEGIYTGTCAFGEDGCLSWENAKTYCSNLNLVGYEDWRLPSVLELMTMFDLERNDYIPPELGTSDLDYYWTSTTAKDDTDRVFYLRNTFLRMESLNKILNTDWARAKCVRNTTSPQTSFTTQVAATLDSLAGTTELLNTDGTSITVSILDSTGSTTLVSGNAGAGTYRQGATILSPSVELEYATAYKYKLETEQGDFTFDFTTPTDNNVELHTGQTTSYGTGPDDADNDGTPKNFTDNGDGTVTDQHTGLMWQKTDAGSTMNWENALTYCNNLNLAGYEDWRMPNYLEGGTFLDFEKTNHKNTVFTYVISHFWLSSVPTTISNYPYVIQFPPEEGSIGTTSKTTADTFTARCVRTP